MIPARGLRWVSVRMRLRSRSQPIALALGFALTLAGAWAWYKAWVGPIRASLAIGVGASILAAAIVAYLSPANEAGYRKFISFGIVDMWSSRHAIKDWVDWMETAPRNVRFVWDRPRRLVQGREVSASSEGTTKPRSQL